MMQIENETKRLTFCQIVEVTECIQPESYSDVSKIYRVMALVLRFIHNCRVVASERKVGAVNQEDVVNAQKYLILWAQN